MNSKPVIADHFEGLIAFIPVLVLLTRIYKGKVAGL